MRVWAVLQRDAGLLLLCLAGLTACAPRAGNISSVTPPSTPAPTAGAQASAPATLGESADSTAEPLKFDELIVSAPVLGPSERAQSLAGRPVRMAGFMADMELPPKGGFFLVPRPVHCDEAGAGTADLPLESVFVIAPSARGHAVPHIPGPVEVVGLFEVGNRAEPDGGPASAFRIRLTSEDHAALASERPRTE